VSTPGYPKREHPSTYFVQDHRNEEELTRLTLQDQMITAGMGGVLPEQPDPAAFRRVLDVGCGTGGWLIQTATTYPSIERLIGVDISHRMVEHAHTQRAEEDRVAHRVEFASMDALRMLEFPDQFFDLVNERFGMSYLRTWDWQKFLSECMRICRAGGVVRCTESDIVQSTTSPALTQLSILALQAFYRAGHFFTHERRGVIDELPHLFKRHGLQNIQTKDYVLHFQAGTEQGELFRQDMVHGFRTLQPFLQKWAQMPDNYHEMCQQALQEMQQPDFEAILTLRTVWGTTPTMTNDPTYLHVP
jgi:ubiquinone/menaquinone biosynthesis C-methylase UbiE